MAKLNLHRTSLPSDTPSADSKAILSDGGVAMPTLTAEKEVLGGGGVSEVTGILSKSSVYDDFQKLDIRVGKIIEVADFPEARKPSYKLKIDFGSEIGIKKSCAQLPQNYTKEQLKNKLVLGVVNFPPRQIGPAISEVLTLGVPDGSGECFLITPDKDVPLGGALY